jgi:hypothetical protein
MRLIHFVIILFLTFDLFSQQDLLRVQPTIMVVPFVKEGNDLRSVFESDSSQHVRVAMAKVKNAFDTAQIKTIDLKSMIQRIDNDRILTHNSRSDLKSGVIHYSGIDIYVEVEAKVVETSRGNSVTVILNTYDAFSGHSLANGFGHSPKFYTQNFEKLSEKALDTFLEEFVISTKSALDDLEKNGRLITLNIGIEKGVKIDMDSEIGDSGNLLADEIEIWLEENAYQSRFNIQGVTSTKMIINEVKIPKIDAKTKRNYRPSKFAKALITHLKSLGIECSRDVQGTNIFIVVTDFSR